MCRQRRWVDLRYSVRRDDAGDRKEGFNVEACHTDREGNRKEIERQRERQTDRKRDIEGERERERERVGVTITHIRA